MGHLLAHVAGQHHPRVIEVGKARAFLLPDAEQVDQHLAVQLVLGGEVVVQVGTRQVGALGDVGHGRARMPLLGEDLLGSQEDFFDVLATNVDLVVTHSIPDQG